MRCFRPLLLLLFFCLCTAMRLPAQNYVLRLHPVDLPAGDSAIWQQDIPAPPAQGSSQEIVSYLKELVPTLQGKGFLAASLDSLHVADGRYDAFLFLGNRYRWGALALDSLPPPVLQALNLRTGFLKDEPLRPRQIERISNKVLDWYENNGYPFARVWLDSIRQESPDRISARMRVLPGTLRRIDSIDLQGALSISPSFLQRYLDVFVGDVYNEKTLRQMTPRLRELPFLRESKPWQIYFQSYDTRLTLFLEPKKANQLDALIGLTPSTAQGGKFQLTVDARFTFQNILSQGESISFSFQNLQYKSPRLKADVVYPYLLGTLFGLEGHFDLYKKDTSYRRTTFQGGARFQLSATDYVKVYYENQSNRLISVDTAYVRRTKKLPPNADVSANGGGLELLLDRTDYRLNPRKGYRLRLNGAGLRRHYTQSDAITGLTDGSGFNYRTLYDSLQARSNQYRANGDAALFLPLGKSLVLRPGYAGGWISSGMTFQNELFLIGGFHLLRGFDEQSIFARQYHLFNLEMRLLFTGNSNVYLFTDNAWVETAFQDFRQAGWYHGLGVGGNLELKNGLFSIGLGVGKGGGQNFELRNAKVHFGYVSFF